MSADEALLRQLVDDYRAQCLWFLRDDCYPVSASEREQVLRAIARYGDLTPISPGQRGATMALTALQ